MTPDEPSPPPVDEKSLAEMMAFDELLHASDPATEHGTGDAITRDELDDRGRSRLMLLLTMLEATESRSSKDGPGTAARSADDGGHRRAGRPLLGRFDVLDELGAGGFGFVVRARDRLLGREVALKMPLPARVLAPGDVDRFLREARAAARLDHPNIVRVFDAGEIGPLGYFIASEFCAGPSLRRWLKSQNRPVPARPAARWMAAIADAVQQAHDRGILHRDIKPDNIILAGGPRSGVSARSGEGPPKAPSDGAGDAIREIDPDDLVPRLTDFGLAKLVQEAGDETRSDARMGTAHYMAPEQAGGRRHEVGPATDIYALGATLYEVLAGRPPFRGETDAETLRLVLEAEPVAPRTLRPGLPRDLDTICMRCLRKEPSHRYPSAGALRDDLRRFLDGRPIFGRPVSAVERARNWARHRPAVAALMGVVVLLACGLVGGGVLWASWLGWHNRQLELQVARADRGASEAQRQTRIAEERRHQADRHHHAEGLRRARRALDARQIELAQDLLRDLKPEPGGDDLRGFAWRYLWRQAHREFSQLWGHELTVVGMALAPDGGMLVTRDLQGKALLWDLSPGMALDEPRTLPDATEIGSDHLAFSPNGQYLAALSRVTSNIRIELFEVAANRHLGRIDFDHGGSFHFMSVGDDGRRVAGIFNRAGGGQSVVVRERDVGGSEPRSPTPDHRQRHPFLPRLLGRRLAPGRERWGDDLAPRSLDRRGTGCARGPAFGPDRPVGVLGGRPLLRGSRGGDPSHRSVGDAFGP